MFFYRGIHLARKSFSHGRNYHDMTILWCYCEISDIIRDYLDSNISRSLLISSRMFRVMF